MLVAATDLVDITGRVFDDFSGNGFDAGEEVAGATLDLYRDNGDGIFNPDDDGTPVMTMTGTDGTYRFSRLTAGDYFVLQDTQNVDGRTLQRSVSPLINITTDDVRGQITRIIDSFEQTFQEVRDTTVGDGPEVDIATAPVAEVIGGERELIVEKTSQNGAVQLSVDDPLLPNQLTFDSVATGQGPRRIVWDGPDNDTDAIDDQGLAGIDLTQNAAGIQVQIRADLPGGTATIRLYSDDGVDGTADRFSSATIPIPQTQGSFLSAEFLPLNTQTFSTISGGGADFTNIGAIEFEINGAPDVNGASELIGAVGTVVKTANFDNFETADLSLAKTVSDPTPNLNQEVTFTLMVDNLGPDAATGVEVTDLLPDGFQFVRSQTANGQYDSGTGVWDVGPISVGVPATLSIVGLATTLGTKTNTAQITAADQIDGDDTNNQASVSLTPESVDLALTKTVDDPFPNVGESVTFTVSVLNQGPSSASNVSVRDILPDGLTLTDSTPSVGNYNTTSGVWTIATIGVNQQPTLMLTATVTTNGTFSNAAEIVAVDEFDSDDTNDQASVSITTPVADLLLTKTVDNPRANVGEEVLFTVVVSNAGPNLATDVDVSDLLPPGLTPIGSTTSDGVYDSDAGVWEIDSIDTTTPATLNIRAQVTSPDPIVNTASITAARQFDPIAGNNQDSVTIDAPSINLSLTKTIDQSRPDIGDEVVYTITLANTGDDPATDIVVRDALPSGLMLVSATPSIGQYSEATQNWTIDMLDASPTETETLLLRAIVTSAVSVTNTAEVIAANEFDINSTPNNGIPSEDDQDSVAFTLASADLSISKTVSDESPNVGQNVTFTIVLSNAGPDSATNVVVRDQLPAGVTFVSASTDDGEYDETSGLWTIPTVSNGTSATLNIIATADSNALTTNVAEVIEGDQLDPDSVPADGQGDDFATASIQGQQVDLSLDKTISNSRPNVGEVFDFVITIDNQGPNVASGVSVVDRLPAGLTLVEAVPSQGSFNTTTGVWTVGSVPVTAASPTLTLTVRADQVFATTTNTAEIVAADQPDSDSTVGNNDNDEDDQDSVTFATPVADLMLTKTVTNEEPNVGETVTFNLRLANDGPDQATGVRVTDVLPDGLRFESSSLSTGTYDSETGIWDIGTLADDDFATLDINATVLTLGTKTNTARVSGVNEFDPDSSPGNDEEGEDDQDSAIVTPPVVDLSLEKTASEMRPSLGETITYSLTARNDGPSDASGVVVADRLPDGVTFVDSIPSTGTYDAATGIWNVGEIDAGTFETLELTATIDSFMTITNSAEITVARQADSDSTPGNDDDTEDDQASVTLTTASADLSLTKMVSDDKPNIGDEVTFTLAVSNAGPDPSGEVTVRDQLPSGLVFVASSTDDGDYDPDTGIWTIPSIDSGSMTTLQIRATVQAQTERTNVAEILSSSQFDPDSTPGNGNAEEDDQASAILSPQLVDLALSKMVDDDTPNVGDTITYTLTLSNEGPSDATGVRVTDRLPTNLTFVGSDASQGSYDSASGVWSIGIVEVGQTPTLDILAAVGSTLGETNTAEVTAVDQVDIDSTPANDAPGEDDQASVDFVTLVSDLSLTKTVDNNSPTRDEVITFTLSLTNSGPDMATNVRVGDSLPAGLQFVAADPSLGTYDPMTGVWMIDGLPSSATPATLRIDARAISPTPSTNIAEVLSVDQFDPDSTPGNAATDEDDFGSVDISPLAIDLSVRAEVDNDEPLEGDTIELTFFTDNDGDNTASGVVTSVLIPDGLTVTDFSTAAGSYNPTTGRWTIGSIAAGSSAVLSVTATVDTRGLKTVAVSVIEANEFDIDSTPGNDELDEDDQIELIIRAPRLLNKRLFLAR